MAEFITCMDGPLMRVKVVSMAIPILLSVGCMRNFYALLPLTSLRYRM